MSIVLSILALLGFIALTAATGIFVAIEFAITGMERATIENHVAEVGDRRAHGLRDAADHLSFELSGAQLGITITTLATGFLAEPVLARFITPLLTAMRIPAETAQVIALVVAMIVATAISMVYGELVPKNWAMSSPLSVARFVVLPVRYFNKAFSGFIRALNWCANALVRRFGIEPTESLVSARNANELRALVQSSGEHGSLDRSQADMLVESLKFGEADADEFMTPRSTIEALQADETVADLVARAAQTGFSRFPVIAGDLDETIGVVHIKQALGIPREEWETTTVDTLARVVPVVPTSLDGDSLLATVRSAGSQMVLVADEYGGTAGIITIEDVIEEILGEVYDEHDPTGTADREFRKIKAGAWDVAGLAHVSDLPETVGYYPPEGPYETLGGLIMAHLGRIPEAGTALLLPQTAYDGLDEFHSGLPGRWLARVTSMDGRRVDRVTLTPLTDEAAAQWEANQ
ncbi:MAG: hemolysin family protein [Corynebacterium sp.]|nr:hemolysin family protein [Corynebacterium sp.]